MYRLLLFGAVVIAALGVAAAPARGLAARPRGEREGRGVSRVARSLRSADLLPGESACDDAECAKAAARSYGASRVIYGSRRPLGATDIGRGGGPWGARV